VLASFEAARAPTGTLVLGAADVLCASASRTGALAGPASAPAAARVLRRPLGRQAPSPMTEPAHGAEGDFRRGLEQLECNEPAAAVTSLRRALYAEPGFGLAAFKLGGAHEALGDIAAAVRAYRQALRALDPHERHEPFLEQIDLADVAAAAQARLDVLA
jgi:tetratricopeptide (TPR) repeat protein